MFSLVPGACWRSDGITYTILHSNTRNCVSILIFSLDMWTLTSHRQNLSLLTYIFGVNIYFLSLRQDSGYLISRISFWFLLRVSSSLLLSPMVVLNFIWQLQHHCHSWAWFWSLLCLFKWVFFFFIFLACFLIFVEAKCDVLGKSNSVWFNSSLYSSRVWYSVLACLSS